MSSTPVQRNRVVTVSLGIAVASAFIAYAAVSVPRAYAYPYWALPYAPQVQFFSVPTYASYFGYSNYGSGYSNSGGSVWMQAPGAAGAAGGAGGSISGGGGNGANGGVVGGQGGSGGGTYISYHSNINSSSVRIR
ncbi:hypothetical protein HYW59_03625 [Candidatus Kaiserbacteria bacterium]|nr:hypothetical protein [Candidatus Kaiserbacteria bacterium]